MRSRGIHRSRKMNSTVRLALKLVPFASPGTPLLQDLLYSAAIAACVAVILYEKFQKPTDSHGTSHAPTAAPDEIRNDEPRADAIDGHEVNEAQQRQVYFFDEEDQARDTPTNVPRPDEPDDVAPAQPHQAGNEVPVARPHEQNDDDAGEGPADGAANNDRAASQARNVGAKKAKSLARRDQRRAFNEFMRNQGDAQRAREAEGAAEREATLAQEREKRAAAEAAIEARKAKEREARRLAEEKARERERRRRTEPVDAVRRDLAARNMSDLWKVVDEFPDLDLDVEFLEKLLQTAGILKNGKSDDGSVTMLTSKSWVVRITRADMDRVYEIAIERGLGRQTGNINFEDIAMLTQRVLEGKA